MQKKTQEKTAAFTGIIFVISAAMLHIFVSYASDDFYYVTFLDDGFIGFLKNMWMHHKTMTGRSLVHFILCPLLQLDMLPFKVFNVCLISGLCAVGAVICKTEKFGFWCGFAVLFSIFWLIGINVLADGVLWGAGSLNYLFPAFMIILLYMTFMRNLCGKTHYIVCMVSFLSAATVEMTGILAVITIIYTALTNPSAARLRKKFVFVNLIAAILGYSTLFFTDGINERLKANEYLSFGLWERMLRNFSLFSRKICSPGGLAFVTALAVLFGIIWLIRQKKYKSAVFGIISEILLFSIVTGACVHNLYVMLVALMLFAFLCLCAVFCYMADERTIPFCMICIAVSLGICVVSPVVGSRMLLPSAVFLMIFITRAFSICGLSLKSEAAIYGTLAITAILVSTFLIVKYAENASVLRENELAVHQYTAGEALQLKTVPDETYGNGTVPTASNFGEHFLRHHNLTGTEVVLVHPVEAKIYSNGRELLQTAVLRNKEWYLPVRSISEISDADISWELASAVVRTENETYRFSSGAVAADLGEGFIRSAKLFERVRMINAATYISVKDFNRLFGSDVVVKE